MDTGHGPLLIKQSLQKTMKLTLKKPFGNTGLNIPQVIYGTSYLGNLYTALAYSEKLALMEKWFECTEPPVFIDTAGKYGAGLALEVIGKGLRDLKIDPEHIMISNKLGWYRVALTTNEPTFEPGAWAELEHDCIQTFGYEAIVKCFEQGNELLGGTYRSELASIHDPDEYLLDAADSSDRNRRILEIRESYRALFDLKSAGKVKAVGIGSKDWSVIKELYDFVPFDWVMLANSYTVFRHPAELVQFMAKLEQEGVGIINSAVFHGGFLTGGAKFDYKHLDPASESGQVIYKWRDSFHRICQQHAVSPADACLQFGLSHPAIASMALNTSKAEKMVSNLEALERQIPSEFWQALKMEGLVDPTYPYL